jgi:hypothetical protein
MTKKSGPKITPICVVLSSMFFTRLYPEMKKSQGRACITVSLWTFKGQHLPRKQMLPFLMYYKEIAIA